MVKTYLDFMIYELDLETMMIITRWTRNVKGDEYKQGLLFVVEAIETYNLKYWLYDGSRYSVPDITDQIWLANVFTPLINKTSIKKAAAIQPDDVILQTVTELVHERSKRHQREDVDFQMFYDVEDAKEWLLSKE
jgi:hypothetical protein